MTEHQRFELQNLCGFMAQARNMVRAGATACTPSRPGKGAPTLEQVLDAACVRAANLLAEAQAEERKAA
jgi:hypothetical protein